ncbi:hypothetical protein [Proteus phage 3H10_20]|uniref:Uncharacterized protein n=2 Tax=Privateervirus TaxID=2843440 RepID=A0A7L7SH03_9CAUD|nr:hypothetical protein HWD17_gp027 [Proteus phage Privateer]YP_010672291.1 hypothetical protein PQC37_gp028 [Proteus phage 3H10_20]QIN94820.1 hypothetical protein CPT_Privateer_027 [Proteus phage Privateer]QOC54814.1 hypothetical protein [Proteus phage 3H10_20]
MNTKDYPIFDDALQYDLDEVENTLFSEYDEYDTESKWFRKSESNKERKIKNKQFNFKNNPWCGLKE